MLSPAHTGANCKECERERDARFDVKMGNNFDEGRDRAAKRASKDTYVVERDEGSHLESREELLDTDETSRLESDSERLAHESSHVERNLSVRRERNL